MPVVVNQKGVAYARTLIRADKVNRSASWSFDAADGNALLGDNNDWENYARYHLAVDTSAPTNTKARWKYPFGKNGVVYRRGVIAAKARAAQQGSVVANAADRLLQMLDKETKNKNTILEMATSFLTALRAYFGAEEEEGEEEDEYKAIQSYLEKAPETVGGDVTMRDLFSLAGSEDDVEAAAWAKDGLAKATEKLNLTGFKVFKALDDNDWWFGWNSNRWIDRDGQVITEEAHKEFMAYLDENPDQAPYLYSIHVPQSATKSRAAWWTYLNGFTMFAGPLTPEEAAAFSKDVGEPVGMSHGFFVLGTAGPTLASGRKKYITRYRSFEVSELPLRLAANPYTEFSTLQETKMSEIDGVKREYLVNRFGEDVVAEFEQATDKAAAALDQLGVEWKSIKETYEEEIEAEKAAAATTEAETIVQQVIDQVLKAMNLESLQAVLVGLSSEVTALKEATARIAELEERVAHLMETEDKRLAEALSPIQPIDWSARPTASNETVKSEELAAEEKEAVNELKGIDWLAGMNPLAQ